MKKHLQNKSSLGLKDAFLSYLSDKVYMIFLLLTAAGGYGFFLTHYSISVDDLSNDRYLSGELFSQGRFTQTILSKILPFLKQTDSLPDFFGIAALCISAILFCIIFDKFVRTKNRIPQILFSCLFISYPLHSELFAYNSTSVSIGFGCVLIALATFFVIRFNENKRVSDMIIAAVILLPVTSWYESVILIYIAIAFSALLLKQFTCGKYKFKNFIFEGLGFLFPLIFAVLSELLLSSLAFIIFSIKPSVNGMNGIYWGYEPFIDIFRNVCNETFNLVFLRSFFYVPITIFVVSLVIILVFTIYSIIKKKGLCVVLSFVGLFITPFMLAIGQGMASAYRICQVYAYVVAFVAFVLSFKLSVHNKRYIYRIVCCVLTLTVVWQISYLDYNFVTDDMRYKEERATIEELGFTLEEKYNLNKPVVFVGEYKLSNSINDRYCIKDTDFRVKVLRNIFKNNEVVSEYLKSDSNGYVVGERKSSTSSYINWSITAFKEVNTELIKFFNYCGFDDIQQGRDIQYLDAKVFAKSMPAWPARNSIRDVGDYILVNLG